MVKKDSKFICLRESKELATKNPCEYYFNNDVINKDLFFLILCKSYYFKDNFLWANEKNIIALGKYILDATEEEVKQEINWNCDNCIKYIKRDGKGHLGVYCFNNNDCDYSYRLTKDKIKQLLEIGQSEVLLVYCVCKKLSGKKRKVKKDFIMKKLKLSYQETTLALRKLQEVGMLVMDEDGFIVKID